MKHCKTFLTALLCLVLIGALALPTAAANVTYSGNAGKIVFTPGSEQSPTDLFTNFKDVMPGDTLTQSITVRNDADNNVKVKIYMRSLGAQKDAASQDFLSKLFLRVEKSADNAMPYMFDASAEQSAQLTDWVLLGTLYSGGEVDLTVSLDVPTTLDNTYKQQIGYLDWEFMVEELPAESSDPTAPETGDTTTLWPWLVAMLIAIAVMILTFRKQTKDEDQRR